MEIVTEDKPETQKEESRWWNIYHIWGGMCFVMFMGATGMVARIIVKPSMPTHAEASSYGHKQGLLIVLLMVLGFLISKYVCRLLNRKIEKSSLRTVIKTLLPVLYFIGVIVGGAIHASNKGSSSSYHSTATRDIKSASLPGQDSDVQPVKVFTVEQGVDGASNDSMTSEVLGLLEQDQIERWKEKARKKYVEQGFRAVDFNPKIEKTSYILTAEKIKLGVINLLIDDSVRLVTIIGFKTNSMSRISCMRLSHHDIPVMTGECGDDVKKAFGLRDINP